MKSERSDGMLTNPVYECDGYIKAFSATVLYSDLAENGYGIILDVTAFFPEGGGQQADQGFLDGQEVFDVQIIDGQIVHFVKENIDVGKTVYGEIDFELRYRRMQQHGAEHLICGIIHEKFGYENSGFHMSEEETVFDVDGPLTSEDILYVERRANEIVAENVPIYVSFPEADEAKALTYRSKLDTFENIRLVTIEGYDVCACCAPMVNSTGQFGVIKITSFINHRGGMRMTLLAGLSAYEDYALLDDANKKIRGIISSKRYETADKTKELNDKCQRLHEENIRLKKEITDIMAEKYVEKVKGLVVDEPITIFTESLDNVQLRNLINACTGAGTCLIAGFIGNDKEGYKYILAASAAYKYKDANINDLKEFAVLFNETLGGRGGGNNEMISGSVKASKEQIEKYLNN